jgi:hypothetical protein
MSAEANIPLSTRFGASHVNVTPLLTPPTFTPLPTPPTSNTPTDDEQYAAYEQQLRSAPFKVHPEFVTKFLLMGDKKDKMWSRYPDTAQAQLLRDEAALDTRNRKKRWAAIYKLVVLEGYIAFRQSFLALPSCSDRTQREKAILNRYAKDVLNTSGDRVQLDLQVSLWTEDIDQRGEEAMELQRSDAGQEHMERIRAQEERANHVLTDHQQTCAGYCELCYEASCNPLFDATEACWH